MEIKSIKQTNKQGKTETRLGCSSVVEHLLSMSEVLGSILSVAKNSK